MEDIIARVVQKKLVGDAKAIAVVAVDGSLVIGRQDGVAPDLAARRAVVRRSLRIVTARAPRRRAKPERPRRRVVVDDGASRARLGLSALVGFGAGRSAGSGGDGEEFWHGIGLEGGGVPTTLAPAGRLLELDAVEGEEGGAGCLTAWRVVELGQGELLVATVVVSLGMEGASAAFGVSTTWLLVMVRLSGGHVSTTVLLMVISLLLLLRGIELLLLLLIINRLLMMITAASLMMT